MKSRFVVAFLAVTAVVGSAQAEGVSKQGSWETTLKARDLNHDGVTDAFYDTALNVTWLRNAQPFGTNHLPATLSFVDNFDFGGYTDWRLPTLGPVNGSTFQYEFTSTGNTDYGAAREGLGWGLASEMGHLYYVTFGNKAFCTPSDTSPASCIPQANYGLTNTGEFQNMVAGPYWTAQDYAPTPGNAWDFNFNAGVQGPANKDSYLYAMVLRTGDVLPAVPEPQTFALMLAGIGLLLATARVRRAN